MDSIYVTKSTRRTLVSILCLLVLVLVVWLIGMVLSYFKTGAEWGYPDNYAYKTLLKNAPDAHWVNTTPLYGLKPDSFQLNEIETAYLEAWQALNLCHRSKETTLLKDHFAENLWSKLDALVYDQEDHLLQQADLEHQLDLHTFALDKQLVAFKDWGVRLKKNIHEIESGRLVYSGIQPSNYEVVMTLDDGRWRIRHMKREATRTLVQAQQQPFSKKAVRIKDKQFYIGDTPFRTQGINYYPQETPWFDFWTQFDPTVINQDFQKISELGFNTLRVFVFYELFGAQELKPGMLDKLEALLDLAQANDLMVMVTLFDFLPSYAIASYPATEKHLKGILSRFKEHPALLAWDLKNEPDLDFDNHGRQTVLEWLEYMLERAQIYDPNHPLTIGWSATEPAALLSKQVDFVSFHFYKKTSLLEAQLNQLELNAGNRPIMISEFGLPSYRPFIIVGGHSQVDQADYYQEVLDIIELRKNISFISWTLYDFPQLPKSVFGGPFWRKLPQKHYGLIRTDGSWKPAAEVIKGHLLNEEQQ